MRTLIKDVNLVGGENLLDEITKGTYGGFISAHDVTNKSFGGLRYGYKEAFRIAKSPTATARQIEQTFKLFDQIKN